MPGKTWVANCWPFSRAGRYLVRLLVPKSQTKTETEASVLLLMFLSISPTASPIPIFLFFLQSSQGERWLFSPLPLDSSSPYIDIYDQVYQAWSYSRASFKIKTFLFFSLQRLAFETLVLLRERKKPGLRFKSSQGLSGPGNPCPSGHWGLWLAIGREKLNESLIYGENKNTWV